MPKFKQLSGNDVITIMGLFSFAQVSQKGNHVKLRHVINGESQTLAILIHKELDRGTANAIFRQACRYVDESSLREHFFTK